MQLQYNIHEQLACDMKALNMHASHALVASYVHTFLYNMFTCRNFTPASPSEKYCKLQESLLMFDSETLKSTK